MTAVRGPWHDGKACVSLQVGFSSSVNIGSGAAYDPGQPCRSTMATMIGGKGKAINPGKAMMRGKTGGRITGGIQMAGLRDAGT